MLRKKGKEGESKSKLARTACGKRRSLVFFVFSSAMGRRRGGSEKKEGISM